MFLDVVFCYTAFFNSLNPNLNQLIIFWFQLFNLIKRSIYEARSLLSNGEKPMYPLGVYFLLCFIFNHFNGWRRAKVCLYKHGFL